MALTPEAGRILGCLVEKKCTTPQQYPLTLNALTIAANQATNRDPVVDLSEEDVLAAVDELRAARLLRVVLPSHGRSVSRYRHVLDEVYGLDEARAGLLAVLLLRGPQTAGELRARTERMVDLPTVGVVHEELTALSGHPDGLVLLLPRRPGQKEERWQQTVAAPWGVPVGEPGDEDDASAVGGVVGASGSDADGAGGDTGGVGPERGTVRQDELGALRDELDELRREVRRLSDELDELRRGLGG
jgi:hypothetical protein